MKPLDLESHPVLQELVSASEKRGWVSYEEINTCLPDCYVDPDAIDVMIALFRDSDVDLVDELGRRHRKLTPLDAPLQTDLKFQRDNARKATRAPKVQMIDEVPAAVSYTHLTLPTTPYV